MWRNRKRNPTLSFRQQGFSTGQTVAKEVPSILGRDTLLNYSISSQPFKNILDASRMLMHASIPRKDR